MCVAKGAIMRYAGLVVTGLVALAVVTVVLLTASTAASPGDTTRVSVASDGNQGGDSSAHTSISADGRYVAFDSTAANLVDGDTNGGAGIFVRDQIGRGAGRER